MKIAESISLKEVVLIADMFEGIMVLNRQYEMRYYGSHLCRGFAFCFKTWWNV
jgi:hypothetical protein